MKDRVNGRLCLIRARWFLRTPYSITFIAPFLICFEAQSGPGWPYVKEIVGAKAKEVTGDRDDNAAANAMFRVHSHVDPASLKAGASGTGPGGPGAGSVNMTVMTFATSQAPARKGGLTLKSLKLSADKKSSSASFLYVEDRVSLVLDDVVGSSVALYCVGCQASIRDSSFTNEGSKRGEGFAHLHFPDGELNPSSDNSWPHGTILDVTNCTFTNITSRTVRGGVVGSSHHNPSAFPFISHFTDCTFVNVINTFGDGGVFFAGPYSVYTFTRCVFTTCSTATNGGVGAASGGLVLMENSTVSGASATLNGGVLYMSGTSLRTGYARAAAAANLKGVEFVSSSAGVGGAIWIGRGTTGTMRGSTLMYNSVSMSGTGGAIYLDSNGAEMVITATVIGYNYALGGFGGAVYASSDSASTGYAPLPKGVGELTSTPLDILNCTLRNNEASVGAGVYANFHALALRLVSFERNVAYVDGGGAHLESNVGGAFACLEDNLFDGNSAPHSGALLADVGYDGAVAIHRGKVMNNSALGYGGGVTVFYQMPRFVPRATDPVPFRVLNTTFVGNRVVPTSRVDPGHGGAVFVYPYVTRGQSPTSAELKSPEAAAAVADPAYVAHFDASVFDGNDASGAGGAIAAANIAAVKVNGCTIRNCNAKEGGGVAALDSAHVRVSKTSITACRAYSSGGGISSDMTSIVTMDDSAVEDCTAASFGGGVAVHGDSVLGMIQSNVSRCGQSFMFGLIKMKGGGVYSTGAGLFIGEGSAIHHNAAASGGGVSVVRGMFLTRGASVFENTASDGGGVEIAESGTAFMTDVTVRNNVAKRHGGGVMLASPYVASADRKVPSALNFAIETLTTIGSRPRGFAAAFVASEHDMVSVDALENVATAGGGGGFFWDHVSRGGVRYACANCTLTRNSAAYGPEVATELLAWGLVPRSNEVAVLQEMKNRAARELAENRGVITRQGMQASLRAMSINVTLFPGGVIPPFEFIAIDAEGQRLVPASDEISVSVVSSGGSLIKGTLKKDYVNGSATFSDVTLSAKMRTRTLLTATATYRREDGVVMTFTANGHVNLDTCARGDYFDASALQCVTCAVGNIAFTRGTTECAKCDAASGIECLGGASYQITDGYWVAEGASACSSFDCLSERVYSCSLGAACTTSVDVNDNTTWNGAATKWRNATGPEGLRNVSLCAVGYASDAVFCGGSSVPKCDIHYVSEPNSATCVACPVKAKTLARFIGVTSLGVLIFVVLCRYLFIVFKRRTLNDPYSNPLGLESLSAEERQDALDEKEAERKAIEKELRDAKKTRGVIIILTGWVQVMGQMTTMVDISIIPDAFSAASGVLNVLNIDIVGLVSFKCLIDDLGVRKDAVGSLFTFWWSVHAQMALPIFLFFITAVTSHVRDRRCKRRCATLRAKMASNGASEEAIEAVEDDEQTQKQTFQLTLYAFLGFIISYIHPSTATVMFKTFDCSYVKNLPDAPDEAWLNVDVSERCFTSTYRAHSAWVVFMIVFFVFGFPVFVAFTLWFFSNAHKVEVVGRRNDGSDAEDASHKATLATALRDDNWFYGMFYYAARRKERAAKGRVYVQSKRIKEDADGRAYVVPVRGDDAPVYVKRITRPSTNVGTKVKRVVPVTRLDTPAVDGVFGMFYDSYEDQYYYWQTIEISRRVLQTSMVTVVRMVFPGFELPYAVAIATLSLATHAFFQPYCDHHKDRLQFFVLLSNWVVLYSLFVRDFNGWSGWAFLVILFGSQALIIGFGLHALYVAEHVRVRGQVQRMIHRAKTLRTQVMSDDSSTERSSKSFNAVHVEP